MSKHVTEPALAVDVRELLQRPGAHKRVTVAAPLAGLATPVASVPPDRPVTVDAEIESVVEGLLVDYARRREVSAIVKGLRAVSDFDYELQMAQMNYRLAGVDTMFMTTNPTWSYLSSSLVKDVARHGGDVTGLVPDFVVARLRERGQQPPA